jgi:hypothetical protein
MTTNILARFVDGKLLIQESKLAVGTGDAGVYSEGVHVRFAHVSRIDKVISVGNSLAKLGLNSPLDQAGPMSGLDTVVVKLFRADAGSAITQGGLSGVGLTSGLIMCILSAIPFSMSGNASLGLLSGITSGLAFGSELRSGTPISGLLTMTVNAIAY